MLNFIFSNILSFIIILCHYSYPGTSIGFNFTMMNVMSSREEHTSVQISTALFSNLSAAYYSNYYFNSFYINFTT